MELVEQIGSGMSRILKAYDRNIFELSPSFTIVTFPFEEAFITPTGEINGTIKSTLEVLRQTPKATIAQLAELTGKSQRIKTPLASMRLMTDLLENAPEDKRSELTDNIRLSLNRTEWLVSAPLKMAKLDSPQQRLRGINQLVPLDPSTQQRLRGIRPEAIEHRNAHGKRGSHIVQGEKNLPHHSA
ncbi:MAG: hypothetical protein LBP73_01955 [Clostridiales Family XIII bacterium]|jgi:signal transduction histidine kinase|nr:hypothetical protein [Clostridiales Family XIII bacterium]